MYAVKKRRHRRRLLLVALLGAAIVAVGVALHGPGWIVAGGALAAVGVIGIVFSYDDGEE